MPRSSRSKSHKQSKHTSKEVREYSDSEEDVKGKERINGKEEGSAKISKDLTSGEKRKVSSHSRDGKDLSGHGNGNGDVAEEYVVSKRRKEKAEGDRWNAGGDDRTDDLVVDKDSKGENMKSKETKVSVDSRSKSSRRHDSASERKEDALSSAGKKDESKGGSRFDSKRKSEKDSGRKEDRDVKEKDRSGADKEKMQQDTGDDSGERRGKRGRENADWPIQDELRNPELEKELEKRIRKRGDGSSDKDKYQDEVIDLVRDSDDKRSSRGNRSKDGRHGDKYREDGERYIRHKENKYRADSDKDNRYKDVKYREDCDRDYKHREDKYNDDGERDNRHKDDKRLEDGDKNNRRKEEKFHEDGDKDNRHKDDRHREDLKKDLKYKEEKHWEDGDRDSRHIDTKQRHESAKDKRDRDIKYKDEPSSRDRTYESEMKRVRDESNAADHHYKKSSNRDMSPIHDDRASRYKEDNGGRRINDKDDQSDVRSRSVKEQRSDVGKKSISGKVDSVMDRGRSTFRNADVDINRNHSRWRRSPSSSTPQDHYRVSKLEESKYRDYDYDERLEHNVSSSREFADAGLNDKLVASRSMEKSIRKDENQFSEISAERRPRADAWVSPLKMVEKSPSSTTAERRYLTRSDVRRTRDGEECGKRGGGSRDYSGRDGRGSREFPMEKHLVDDRSQADGDNISVSSPFTRNNNFNGNSRTILPPTTPPPPFRTGVDNPAVFGSSEDENRSRSNNRHRRIGDSNIGRPQGNAWRGVPNWPSPIANGFLPFPHVPPPVGFHPVMQQFPAPPIFGVRPTMELNHNLPYHMPDADRFSSQGRPLGWRNSVDDLYPPPPLGWDTNNSVFSEDTRVFGRLDLDQNRTQMGSRGWDTSVDMWKGQNSGLGTELPSASQKVDFAHPTSDQVSTSLEAQTVQDQPNEQVESFDVQSSDALDNITSEAPNSTPEDGREMSKMSVKDDVHLCNVYLSKLDISTDLTQPELYEQFISFIDLDQGTVKDEDNFRILYLEEALEAKVADECSSEAIFAAINDSVFQKAMSLYEKQREEYGTINKERVSSPDMENQKVVQMFANDKTAISDDDSGVLGSSCDGKEAEYAVLGNNESVLSRGPEACPEGPEPAYQKLDMPCAANMVVVSQEQVAMPNVVKMEVNSVPKLEIADIVLEDKSFTQNLEPCDALLPGNFEEEKLSDSPGGFHPANNAQFLVETQCDPLHFSDASSEVREAMMPESIQFESVNVSRIHHSPESTH